MILSNTTLDILVNGLRVDILDRNSINLRINNVLYNPTEINSKLAEYSFSFNLPTTPNNNKIFDYANETAKLNKFKKVYNCEVYADEILIFNGSLRVSTIKKGFYNVNLVNIKINTLDDIFGEMKLNELDWKIPFDGANSINLHNQNPESKVIFPLVSYGVFQKEPASTQYDYNNYTSKFKIDKYNKWYYESFNPSPNLLEIIKRLFELKGFKVQGNVFQDPVIPNLYTSMNITDDLIPTYNLGESKLGKAMISTRFSNYKKVSTGTSNYAFSLEHTLGFPYQHIRDDNWNFGVVDIYDIWSSDNSEITRADEHYLFDDFSNCIVIPADGLYKISVTTTINLPTLNLTAQEWYIPSRHEDPALRDIQLENSLLSDMPVEIQLVKNENECELIHGAYQWGKDTAGNKYSWYTAYPHEELYRSSNPTVTNALFSSNRVIGDSNGRPGGRVEHNKPHYRPGLHQRPSRELNVFYGYMPKEGQLLAYDPWVNPNFIAGISSLSGATPSFIKNGYSWNKAVADKNNSRYEENGYYSLNREGSRGPGSSLVWKETSFNKNTLLDSPRNVGAASEKTVAGSVSGIVELKRNDVLMLKALARHWEDSRGAIYYNFDCDITVEIEAYSPNAIESLDYNNRGWNSPSEFDKDLLIGNFLNKEVKVSDFINNFIKLFNLLYVNSGNTIILDTQNLNINKPKYAIDLDNRVNKSESSLIEYPNYMEVKYKIDTDEWGFETTVPKEHINDANWKDYGDYGYSRININDREDGQGEEVQLTTSYCWYDTFEIWGEDDVLRGTLRMPVISKFSYMIDGYSYEDSMKYDGKSLPMRYWFRGDATGFIVNVNGKYPVTIYTTSNVLDDKYEISYRNKDNTLLTRYFNIDPDLSSNYVSLRCYINSYEYDLLKKGANVRFDSDVYIVGEIQGYDVMGINETELLLIKK